MNYRSKKEYLIDAVSTNKITTPNSKFTVALIAVIVSYVAVVTTASILIHKVDAQMNNSSNMAGSTGSMKGNEGNSSMGMSIGSNMMAIPPKAPQLNITTAAPPISPTEFKSMASQIHVDLINATMIAQKWVGSNSRAVSSMVAIQNGTPVYTIWVIDSNSGLHQILVDPQNGKVVFANQPMSMSGPFS